MTEIIDNPPSIVAERRVLLMAGDAADPTHCKAATSCLLGKLEGWTTAAMQPTKGLGNNELHKSHKWKLTEGQAEIGVIRVIRGSRAFWLRPGAALRPMRQPGIGRAPAWTQ